MSAASPPGAPPASRPEPAPDARAVAVAAARVTVAVCTRDRARLLDACLGALARSLAGAEVPVLVVDNGSQDATAHVARERSRDLRLRRVLEPRVGLSHARNRAVADCDTEYLAFLDDDARPAAGWWDAVARGIARWDPDAFGGPYEPLFEEDPPGWFHTPGDERPRYGWAHRDEPEGPIGTGETRFLSGGNGGWRVSLLREVSGFSPDLGMSGGRVGVGEETDAQVRIRALHPDARLVFLPDMMVLHRVAPEKLRWRYYPSRSWRAGRAHGRVFGPGRIPPPLEPPVALAALAASALALPFRDRRRYPRWQNHLLEAVCPRIEWLGTAVTRAEAWARRPAG